MFSAFKTPVLMALLLVLALANAAPAASSPDGTSDRPTLRVGFVEFPPFKYADENGKASGPWVEMTERVASKAGYGVDWVELPIARIYRYLKGGEIDLWPGVADIPYLEGHVYESSVTPMRVRLLAFRKAERDPVDGLEDLVGRRLIMIKGFSYLGVLEPINLDDDDIAYAQTHESALRMLTLDRGNYLLDYDAPVNAIRGEFPRLDLEADPLYQARGAFIVPATRPGGKELLGELEAAYRELSEQGELQSLK